MKITKQRGKGKLEAQKKCFRSVSYHFESLEHFYQTSEEFEEYCKEHEIKHQVVTRLPRAAIHVERVNAIVKSDAC